MIKEKKPRVKKILLTVALLLPFALADRAWAMHLADGILPPGWAAFWYLLIVAPLALALRRLRQRSAEDPSFKPLVGFVAALVFIISLMAIPIPFIGASSHPTGTGISGVILGPVISVLVATASLLLQALFLGHGGLTTLGANVFAMGVMGAFTAFLVFRGLHSLGVGLATAGFAAGFFANVATNLTTALQLALGVGGDAPWSPVFLKIVIAFLPAQIPIGVIDGALTGGMLVFLHKRRPDIMHRLKIVKPEVVST